MEDAVALAELRDRFDITQTELAGRLGTTQGGISRLERRDDLYLSTLRDYVRALGGELNLVAHFPDGSVVRIAQAREALPVG
jgi:transcriptional regulator with XRE-family HTH domain